MRIFFSFNSILLFSILSFTSVNYTSCVRSGIRGHIYQVSGNQMPSPDVPRSEPKGMKTTLYIYPLTNLTQVVRDGNSAFYKQINNTLIDSVESATDGTFNKGLPPGFYSLFIKKGNLYYANIFDDRNNIYPVEVKDKHWTEVDFRADYDATY